MIVVYALNIEHLDPDNRDWSGRVDARRAAAVPRFRKRQDRARCIGAGLLLTYAARRNHPDLAVPPRVEPGAYGKPWLPELPDFHFNISHSGKWVVCGVGCRPLGVDIERTGRNSLEVVKRCFSVSEQNHLQSIPQDKRDLTFIELWVLKESYMKATGLGLRLNLKDLDVLLGPPAVMHYQGRKVPYGLALCEFEDSGYRLGLAVEGAGLFPRHRIEQVELNTLLDSF
ncbi:MAG: 4'-phosphopantetheinyl transferase superfamily protein [Desulfonatronovibrio sp.]